MTITWLVTLPPFLVLGCALITRRMIPSLLLGIASGALIATQGSIVSSIYLIVQRFSESAGLNKISTAYDIVTNWNLSVFVFLISLGIMVTLLQKSGSSAAFIALAQRHIKSKRGVEIATLLFAPFFFIDDYFSALTVGSVMRPLASLYKVHPVKLAFLVIATASPIAILSPLSSWVGEIVLQLRQVGIGGATDAIIAADPFYVFVRSIPFIFYALLLIFAAWYIVLRNISFGPMARFESNMPIAETERSKPRYTSASLIDFIMPLLFLIGVVFAMLLYTGECIWLSGDRGCVEALKCGSIQQAFLVGGIMSLLMSFSFLLLRGAIKISMVGGIVLEGFQLMASSLLMLINVWTLSAILKQDLQTGVYVAQVLSSSISPAFLPLGCFIIAASISTMIGSAWGTMGLMFPIVIPLFKVLTGLPPCASLDTALLVLPVTGAVLSGCVMGTHLSLLADNPLMAAASTGANHFDLIKALFAYIVPVGCASAVGFTVLAFMNADALHQLAVALLAGIISLILILECAQRIWRK